MVSQEFFQRDTQEVARNLVGCFLIVDEEPHMITDTEGYLGEEDTASHARFGKTERSKIMYGPPGVVYVYLIYGLHHMLNIVTQPEGQPGAVLIRGIEGYDGPGKLTSHLGITKKDYNGKALGRETGVWIEGRSEEFDPDNIQTAQRIGIDYATEEWVNKPLRFVLAGEKSVD